MLRKELVVYGARSHSKLKFFVQDLNEKPERSVILNHTDKVEIVDIVRKLGQIVYKTNDNFN